MLPDLSYCTRELSYKAKKRAPASTLLREFALQILLDLHYDTRELSYKVKKRAPSSNAHGVIYAVAISYYRNEDTA